MLRAAAGLGAFGKAPRCAHLVHDGFGDIVVAPGEFREYRFQQLDAPFTCGRRVTGFGSLGGGDGTVDVGG